MEVSGECRPNRAAHSVYEFKPVPYSSHTLLLETLPPEGHGRRVLDLGCANGYLGEVLAARGFDVVGVERAGLSGDQFPVGVQLVEADLDLELPPLGRFDYILCADILEHLQDPPAFLREIRPMLASRRYPGSLAAQQRARLLPAKRAAGPVSATRPRAVRPHPPALLHLGRLGGSVGHSGYRIGACGRPRTPFGLALPRWADTLCGAYPGPSGYPAMARLWKTMFAYQFVVTARSEDAESMTGKPKVVVVMPAYNAARTLAT